jgi:hypothetical protein
LYVLSINSSKWQNIQELHENLIESLNSAKVTIVFFGIRNPSTSVSHIALRGKLSGTSVTIRITSSAVASMYGNLRLSSSEGFL